MFAGANDMRTLWQELLDYVVDSAVTRKMLRCPQGISLTLLTTD